MNFYIREKSTMPHLQLSFTKPVTYDNGSFFDNLKNAKVYFEMESTEGCKDFVTCGLCELCEVKKCNSCPPEMIVIYKFKKEDTSKRGMYKARIKIRFYDSEDILILPVKEDLNIFVQ